MVVPTLPAWFVACVNAKHDFGITHSSSTSVAWCLTCGREQSIREASKS